MCATEIKNLVEQCKEKDEMIANLQTELDEATNLYNYKINNYEKKLQALQTGLISKFQKDMKMELDGLTEIAIRLNSNYKTMINAYIANIKQLIKIK